MSYTNYRIRLEGVLHEAKISKADEPFSSLRKAFAKMGKADDGKEVHGGKRTLRNRENYREDSVDSFQEKLYHQNNCIKQEGGR